MALSRADEGISMSELSPLIYVVDDDASVREALENLIRSAGLRVEAFALAQEFLASARPNKVDVPSCLVLDVQLPGLSGLDLQQELAKAGVQIPIIFLTGHGNIPMSVQAIKAGALEFLTKPFDDEDLLDAIQQGIARDQRARQQRDNIAPHNFGEIVGTSTTLRSVLNQVELVAPTNSTALILGETGTGKELIARAIHNLSSRSNRPFVKLNCAAIPSGLLESELFGHEKGAFTGAVSQKIGRFGLAHGGTLFLDEVGDIPLELQPKLLRVLQEQEFERLGSTRTVRVDVRLVAATNRDLAQMVAEKQFREDLYFRLNVFPIRVPPLRERVEDIPLLVRHYVDKYAQRMNKRIETIPEEAMALLCHYSWPGNIRELQNLIERAVILTRGRVLEIPFAELKQSAKIATHQINGSTLEAMAREDILVRELQNLIEQAVMLARGYTVENPLAELALSAKVAANQTNASTREAMERERILDALRESNWVIGGPTGAAARLGLNRTTLHTRMSKLGITRPRPDQFLL
jgi:DNA-binding NtrC family response regulator